MPTPSRGLITGATVAHAPSGLGRRAFLGAIAWATLSPSRTRARQLRRYRVLLNSGFSGPQAFFFVAQDNGYLREAGLDAEFVGGDGAAAIVPRIGAEGFDVGYGDLNALVPLVARGAADAPIAVYVTFNTTPLTIAVEGARLGIGDVDDGRLARSIALIAKGRALPRVPAPAEIFTRACLPPTGERVTTLAR